MAATQLQMSATPRATSVQAYARMAGVLFLLSIIGGGFGEFYASSALVVPGDAAATAHNLIASNLFYRLGFLGYLTEAVCDVGLAYLLYILLRPVHPNLVKLAVLFRIMATATFAFSELFYFAPTLILGGDGYLKSFSPDQLHALVLLSLNIYGTTGNLYIVFYGIASLIFGYLMMRSGYFPRVLGALLALGGLGFVIMNVLLILTPAYASSFLLLPTILAIVSLAGWLLFRGVDVVKWQEQVSASANAM